MIYIQIPREGSKRDRPTRGRSRRPNRPKSKLRAYMCRYYDTCLSMAACLGHDTIPCKVCKERRDIPAYDLEDNDMLNYRILLAAIFYPEAWRGSLFYTLRQLSYDVSQELETHELGGA